MICGSCDADMHTSLVVSYSDETEYHLECRACGYSEVRVTSNELLFATETADFPCNFRG